MALVCPDTIRPAAAGGHTEGLMFLMEGMGFRAGEDKASVRLRRKPETCVQLQGSGLTGDGGPQVCVCGDVIGMERPVEVGRGASDCSS